MPLCPQITNTPVTVVQNSDFDVTSVVPVFGNTQDGLASTIDSIEVLADGKTKVYRSATEPTGAGINDGDLWIDTDDGNKLYVRASGAWVSAQDAGIAAASSEAAAASAAAASAVSTANAAAATAGTAQSTANTALANAATAYTAATGSLQPSANTIVNASNQITAINSSGITIYSGASSTTGSRVVLNSLGLAAYGPGTSYSVTNAVGNGTTVTYTAIGHNFTVGSTVTVSELAPAGYNGTFLITAVVAGSTFTVSNTTTATLTDSNGLAYGPGRSVNITNAVGNGSTVTYTASGHGFGVGTSVTVTGLAPDGYNGTFLITSIVAGSTFTVSNGTTATLTDSSGVAQTATLAISATTGNAVFQGSITGSTIIGGTLNIAGKAIIDSTGLLTATGATITGTINAEAGYFGTPTNGFSISATGLVGVGTGTIVGGTIQGATFNNGSGTFFVSSAGVVTAISGTIGGWSLSSTSISKTVGTKTMTLDSSNAILTITDTSSGVLAGGGINITSGSTTGTYGAGGFSFGGNVSISLNSGDLYLQGGATSRIRLSPGAGLGSTTYWVQVEGHLNSAAYTLSTGTWSNSSTSQTEGTYLSQTGAMIARRDDQIPMFAHRYRSSTPYTGTTQIEMWRGLLDGNQRGSIFCSATGSPSLSIPSDYRLKENIRDFVGAVDVIKSKKLRIFNLKNDPNKTDVVGFIAHEFGDDDSELVIGKKDAVDADGNPEYQSVAFTNIIPYLVGALKEIILRVETLEQGE